MGTHVQYRPLMAGVTSTSMQVWPVFALGLGGALACALAWGVAGARVETQLRSEIAASEASAERARGELRQLTERVDTLEDDWRTLAVVHTAIEVGGPLAGEAQLPAPAPVVEHRVAVTAMQAPPPPPLPESFLNMNSIPPSTCILDGSVLGVTPRIHVSVKPGRHLVEFVNSDLGVAKTQTVTVSAGDTRTASVRFEVSQAPATATGPEGF